ncbi:hypothetical protein NX059_003343 [Plenodomus lindquistii]|nr:hypothetical protein NX059_003343 [Plenodomus lindquistii]
MPQRDFSPPVIECCIVKKANEGSESPSGPNVIPIPRPDPEDQQQLPRQNAVMTDAPKPQSPYTLPEVLSPSTEILEAGRPLPPSDHTNLIDGLLYKPVG